MKKLKNDYHFVNIDHMEKFQITDPPQSLGLQFSECQWKWNITVGHYEKFKKWLPFKYQPPSKFGSPVFRVSMETECHRKTGDANFLFCEFSIGSFFPITHPRLHFNIYVWLHLKHLCMDIYAWFTSHLCVVLHYLIFCTIGSSGI